MNLFEFEQITREKYSEISKNSIDINNIHNQNNFLQNAGSTLNVNNYNNQENGYEEDNNVNMMDENDENLSLSDKSSNKIMNLSSPVKSAGGFKSSIRSKSRSSIKSSMIKPIQPNPGLVKKSIKSTGGVSSSKLLGDFDDRKKTKSNRKGNFFLKIFLNKNKNK